MYRRYNIYDMVLRAAAGDPPTSGAGGDDGEGGASASANAKTINAGDPDDVKAGAGGDTNDAGGSGQGNAGGVGQDDAGKTETSGAGDVTADGTDDNTKKPKVVPQHVMLRRVGELSRDKKSLLDENAELRRQLAAKGDGAGGSPSADDGVAPQRSEFKTDIEFQQAVRREAARQRQQEDFDNKCNAVADTGEKEYKEAWSESVANLRMLGEDGQIPLSLLNAALAADDPAKALHELGQNPEEAMRVLSLPTAEQRVAEIVKKGLKVAPKAGRQSAPRSKAPEPIEPLGGGTGSAGDDGLGDNVDDRTWLENRNAQVKAKRIAENNRMSGR